jgi:hypothetical protein
VAKNNSWGSGKQWSAENFDDLEAAAKKSAVQDQQAEDLKKLGDEWRVKPLIMGGFGQKLQYCDESTAMKNKILSDLIKSNDQQHGEWEKVESHCRKAGHFKEGLAQNAKSVFDDGVHNGAALAALLKRSEGYRMVHFKQIDKDGTMIFVCGDQNYIGVNDNGKQTSLYRVILKCPNENQSYYIASMYPSDE